MRVSCGIRYNKVLSRVQQMGQYRASQLPCPKARAEYSFLGPLPWTHSGVPALKTVLVKLEYAFYWNLITHPHFSVSMALGRRGAVVVRPGAGTFDSPWSLLSSDSLVASGKLRLEPWLQVLCP